MSVVWGVADRPAKVKAKKSTEQLSWHSAGYGKYPSAKSLGAGPSRASMQTATNRQIAVSSCQSLRCSGAAELA